MHSSSQYVFAFGVGLDAYFSSASYLSDMGPVKRRHAIASANESGAMPRRPSLSFTWRIAGSTIGHGFGLRESLRRWTSSSLADADFSRLSDRDGSTVAAPGHSRKLSVRRPPKGSATNQNSAAAKVGSGSSGESNLDIASSRFVCSVSIILTASAADWLPAPPPPIPETSASAWRTVRTSQLCGGGVGAMSAVRC